MAIDVVEIYAGTAPELLLSDAGIDSDFVQVKDVQGLDPVKADISTQALASTDGEQFTGGHLPNRNIVLTLRPNPDWVTHTYDSLREIVYKYFIPKALVNLIFHVGPDNTMIEIFGYVENITDNHFSKEPEYIVSIICPDPFFTAQDPVEYSGSNILPEDFDTGKTIVTVNGNVPIGFFTKITWVDGDLPSILYIQVGNQVLSYFALKSGIGAEDEPGFDLGDSVLLEVDSVPLRKFVRNVNIDPATIVNKLSAIQPGSSWPVLQPGVNDFAVMSDTGTQNWTIKFFEQYGGL